ncbi:MAG: peptide ABC transporter substrate-binding protein, partial [Alphaproteobacteria bacterium]|nr:peptide ABC transporter substrate-binding protein [Alphaproteobacteria bacterium]
MIRLLAVASLVLLTGLVGMSPAVQAASKERLTIGISQYPSTLHPAFDAMLAKTYVVAMARRPITVFDPDWKQVCLLCTSLPSLENGTATLELTPDGEKGMAVQYELLPDAVWGDGTPITTQDVLFSVEMGKDPQSGVDNAEQYRRIDRVEVQSDKRFTLHLNKRSCDYQGLSGLPLLPRHIEKKIFDQGAAEYRRRTAYDTDSTNPGLWHGPYRIAKVSPGQSILLERNPKWWGKPPYFDEIEIRTIENTAALTANLLSGDIDMIAGELGLSVDQALAFQDRYGDDYQILFKPSLVYEHIDLNLDNPILKDVRVRQALLYGTDRTLITERLFKGKQPVAQSNVNPLDIRYDPDIRHYAYDPEKAAALLEQAGWAMGQDGIRQKDGTPLTLVLQTT